MAAKNNVKIEHLEALEAHIDLSIGEGNFTRYEKARMIGSRALQIAQGAEPLVKIPKKDIQKIGFNPIEIAKLEYEAGVIPISVKRSLPRDRQNN